MMSLDILIYDEHSIKRATEKNRLPEDVARAFGQTLAQDVIQLSTLSIRRSGLDITPPDTSGAGH